MRPNRPDPAAARSALDQTLAGMSLKQLDESYLVLKVAYNKSLESWQGGSDDVVAGCKITGKEAEAGLAALRPWLDKAVDIEAKRIADSPKSYRVPVDDESCEKDCTCGLGLRILGAAKLDDQSFAKVKEFKRLRGRLESKNELLSPERFEICADQATWICSSDFLKALKPAK